MLPGFTLQHNQMGQKETGLALRAGCWSQRQLLRQWRLHHSCLRLVQGLAKAPFFWGPRGIVGFMSKPPSMGQQQRKFHLLIWWGKSWQDTFSLGRGREGSGAEVERGAKSVGGKHELKGWGREWEAEEPFQPWSPTVRDGEGHQMAFSSLCSIKNRTACDVGHINGACDTT